MAPANKTSRIYHGWTFSLSWVLLSMVGGPVSADSTDERFLEGLRQRRLFQLARTYCRQRLASAQLSTMDRTSLTIELARTCAQQAIHTPRSRRGPLWRAAREAVSLYSHRYANSPRLVLVRMQDALTLLVRGELARQESEVGAAGAPSLEEARRQLRRAIDLLESLNEEVARQLRRPGRPGPPGALSESELLSLQKNIQYQLARAFRNQAQSYPVDSADRVNSLTRALLQLAPLVRSTTEEATSWRSRIDQIVCYRLLQKHESAARELTTLESSQLPSVIRLRARAERARLELDTGQPRAALRALAKGRIVDGFTSAELDLAHVETYIALWQLADKTGDQAQAASWQDQAAQMVRLIEQRHGPYWTRRAEMLLARSAAAGSGAGNLEVLVRAARNYYSRHEYDDAVLAYERAAKQAQALGQPERIFELYLAAGLVQQKQGRPRAALDRFRHLALSMVSQSKASRVHLAAVRIANQLARDKVPETLPLYEELLHEHLAKWPRGVTADESWWRLALLREHRRAWRQAIQAYRAVSVDFANYEAVVRGAARSYDGLLGELRSSGKPLGQEADQAARYFEKVILGSDGKLPERWSPLIRFAAVTAARTRLQYTSEGFQAVQSILQASLDAGSDAPQSWRTTAQALLVVALAGQARLGKAKQVLTQISSEQPTPLLEMLGGLSKVTQSATGQARVELASLQLSAVQMLREQAARLDSSGRLALNRYHAEALAAAGQRVEALAAYQRIARRYPNDGPVQEAYAQLLLDGQERQSLELARAAWRKVLRKSRPQTSRWYRAKYAIALAHYKLGSKRQAADMIRLLKTLHPELGGPEMEKKFSSLLVRCQM